MIDQDMANNTVSSLMIVSSITTTLMHKREAFPGVELELQTLISSYRLR